MINHIKVSNSHSIYTPRMGTIGRNSTELKNRTDKIEVVSEESEASKKDLLGRVLS